MKKVVFDTDIGIDDAMALLFLHYTPDIELKAIVTGFGNASIETTTRNALYMKETFGMDVPVFRGAGEPLGNRLGEGYPDFVHGSNGLGDIEMTEPVVQVEALTGAEAIVEIAKQDPQEISLVAVGRLTNLALALELCPELPELVKEVVIMGGAFGFNGHRGNVSPVAEANIAGDPLAADRVFTSGLRITVVGLDVTQETIAGSKFFDQLKDNAGSAGDFIYHISRFYLDFHKRLTGRYECPLHDSSAVAFLLTPYPYITRPGIIRVVTEGVAIGQTVLGDPDAEYELPAWKGKPISSICTSVNPQMVLDLYTETLELARD